MKYMGSKRSMLKNGLGDLILEKASRASRFVDLFSGSGVVAWFTAEHTRLPVWAYDLQDFAVVFAKSVIARRHPLDSRGLSELWLKKVGRIRPRAGHWEAASKLDRVKDVCRWVQRARVVCSKLSGHGPIWESYGGYYYSPTQALAFDLMLRHLPGHEPERSVCLAAALFAASKCAAAPGHTAQPFRPTNRAARFIREAWQKDPIVEAGKALDQICPRHAQVTGSARTGEACEIARHLRPTDLVFVDPPYSGVHYSRFYHVLETMARGDCGPVTGAGRYPPLAERPQSDFSVGSRSRSALETLLSSLAQSGASVILTFPAGECSNGLSGGIVLNVSRRLFVVDKRTVQGRFSSLGGNNTARAARSKSEELLLFMHPK